MTRHEIEDQFLRTDKGVVIHSRDDLYLCKHLPDNGEIYYTVNRFKISVNKVDDSFIRLITV